MGFAQLTRLGRPDTQMIADLPDLTLMFEASQGESKKELDDFAVERAYAMFRQVGSLKLDTSDLKVFKDMSRQLLGKVR